MQQVNRHTPGYHSWQGSVWLGHCGAVCIFVGSAELAGRWHEMQADIVASGWNEAATRQGLHRDGDLTGYLFRCQQCGQHRLHIDAS